MTADLVKMQGEKTKQNHFLFPQNKNRLTGERRKKIFALKLALQIQTIADNDTFSGISYFLWKCVCGGLGVSILIVWS